MSTERVGPRAGRPKKLLTRVDDTKKETNQELFMTSEPEVIVQSQVEQTGSFEVLEDPLRMQGASRLARKSRSRAGWHQVWKHPDEVDDSKEVGYRFVRENKGDEDLGKESGAIIQVSRDEKTELYLMEVEQWKFDRHLQALSSESRAKYGVLRDGFRQQVEEVNVRVGGRGREIGVIDDSD